MTKFVNSILLILFAVPGVGGNQLFAKLNKPSTVNYWCTPRTDDYFALWLDPMSLILPYRSDCWVDNVLLYYNNITRTTSNSPVSSFRFFFALARSNLSCLLFHQSMYLQGVVITTGTFSSTDSMEWIDPSTFTRKYDFGAYFTYLVDNLIANGYERLKSLFGMPYDFRKGPS